MHDESATTEADVFLGKESVRTDFNITDGLTDPVIAEAFYDNVATIRAKCPVSWTDAWGGSWHLTRYEDVFTAARNQSLFTTEYGAAPLPNDLEALRLVPLEIDDPRHRELRRKLATFFTREAIKPQEPIIQKIIEEHIAKCIKASPCDFAQSFGNQVPAQVFTSLVLHEDDPKTVAWIRSVLNEIYVRPEAMGEWAMPLLAWCRSMLELRRSEGRTDDLIGTIAHLGFDDGVEVSERERAEALWLIINAGMDTTTAGLNSAAHLLATDHALRDQLRDADEATLDRAVDELLRTHPPVTASNRTLRRDAVIGGCPMKMGDRVLVNWGGGSLDPEMFPNPDVFDLQRPNANRHLSLGGGSHRCMGAALAEAEIRITLEQLSKLNEFTLVADADVRWRAANSWGPIVLPVQCS